MSEQGHGDPEGALLHCLERIDRMADGQRLAEVSFGRFAAGGVYYSGQLSQEIGTTRSALHPHPISGKGLARERAVVAFAAFVRAEAEATARAAVAGEE